MSAPSKRLHRSYYLSLPVVVAIVFLLVAKLLAMQRADIIAELTDRVVHRDTEEAAAAVRELGAMSHPPAAVLVAAAAGADRQVADEAQQAIGKWLGRSQRQLEAGRRVQAVSRQLAELAQSLAAQRDTFSSADQPWLVSTTQRILKLANQVPAMHSPLVATHCDEILASIPNGGMPAALTSTASDVDETSRVVAPPERNAQESMATQSSGHGTQAAPSTPSDESVDTSIRTDWSRPVFRMLPTSPVHALPIDAAPPPSTPASPERPPVDVEIIERPLAEIESRTLLKNWLVPDAANRDRLEQELKQRGFGRPTTQLVRRLLSDRSKDRLQLVDDVLTEPGVDARPWLVLLADDADADVRLAAVTIMATSNDATLVEKAWQTAIRDRDPRIAGLAGRLRERRAATQRR